MIWILVAALFVPSLAWAEQTATVAWSANTEPDLAGYQVYYGYITCATVGPLQPPVRLAKVTSHTLTVPAGTSVVSARVTAYDGKNNESAKSACVEKTFQSTEPPPTDLATRVSVLEAKVTALDAKVSALDLKITAVENQNAQQDGRLSGLEQKLNALREGWCQLRGRDVTKDVQSERAALGGC